MSYRALYRTWRPQSFEDLVGQPHVRQTLTNALTTGQVAHAYLFTGPRGTGKTSAAKVLAKAVNCENPTGVEPCNECRACTSITNGSNVDVEEIDAASNRGVDEIRELRDKVHYAPATLKKKVYIVDEVHMLTTEAFNALLKTLEEPPSHALFILATTEPHKIPGTIVSRCQRFDFRRITAEQIFSHLKMVAEDERYQVASERALWRLAEAADGGLRDALGLLEQTAAFGQGTIDEPEVSAVIGGVDRGSVVGLIEAMIATDYAEVVVHLGNWYQSGKEASRITFDLLQLVRDLFIVKLSQNDDVSHRYSEEEIRVASRVRSDWLLSVLDKLGELYTQLRYVDQPRIALEAAVLGLAHKSAEKPTEQQVVRDAPVTTQPEGVLPSESTSVQPPESPQADSVPAAKRRNTATMNASRKREVLLEFHQQADEALLSQVVSRWDEILQAVKNIRIQTHAWLMNGQPVLATDSALVLSFVSRIHRDAVMKPEERQAIVEGLRKILGSTFQLFALLKADWDDFENSLQTEAKSEVGPENEDNIVDKAKRVFGEDKVRVEEEN